MTRDMTPLMKQYREIKAHHEDAILMFRMGDFYEMFYDDAETAARVLGLTLTARNNGGAAEVPLAGVPVKAVSEYLRRLVQHGFRVAICEQMEDPKLAKGIVRRAVVETVTPGAAFADDLLESDRNNFLCALYEEGEVLGVAAADVSTGTFHMVLTSRRDAAAVLARFTPREVLVARNGSFLDAGVIALDGSLVTERDAWEFDIAIARDEIARQFGVHSLDGLGMDHDADTAVRAAGALIRYLRELQPGGVPHLARPTLERSDGVMPLDEMTRRNLELVESLRGGGVLENRDDVSRSGTLLGVLDRTQTGMGARLIRQWVLAPLLSREAIEGRLDAVGALVADLLTLSALRSELAQIRDVERLTSKTAAGRSSPRELRALGDSLAHLPRVAAQAREVGPSGLLGPLLDEWDGATDIAEAIAASLVDRPALSLGEGDVIRPGVDADLDELRGLRDGGKDAIASIQASERARTGISSLKVGFNKVFGYYIEVTNTNRHLVPDDYQRRQTLSGAERYVTPALKEHEERVLTATERIEHRERELFETLRQKVGAQVERLQRMARCIATLDVLASFAEVAAVEGYSRPELHDGFDLDIVGGRHPVVERMMPRERFIPNDVHLSAAERLVILTGPNMAGKSTILRQVGLTVLMAQIGSFVPAIRARLGVVDRIFTRVGASDNLVRGQSTFMVEMAETSAILHTATSRSLVLLDEIGRGTSTYDGVSIAWAVSEHLHDHVGCKTIFATHYHELTQLADELVSACNYNVAVRESGDEVLFLYRLQPGGADRSYGIEVGRLAGLPVPVISRARRILQLLEAEHLAANPDSGSNRQVGAKTGGADPRGESQLRLFGDEHPVLERLRAMSPDRMTPLEALQALDGLIRTVRDG